MVKGLSLLESTDIVEKGEFFEFFSKKGKRRECLCGIIKPYRMLKHLNKEEH